MCDFGALTQKPHYGYSNSSSIQELNNCGAGDRKRKRDDAGIPKVQTCRTYKNKEGKDCFAGTSNLKQTQNLSYTIWFYTIQLVLRFDVGSLKKVGLQVYYQTIFSCDALNNWGNTLYHLGIDLLTTTWSSQVRPKGGRHSQLKCHLPWTLSRTWVRAIAVWAWSLLRWMVYTPILGLISI